MVTRYNSAETIRVRGKSFWVTTIAYNALGASTKRYAKNSGGSWSRGGSVVVSGTVSKSGCSESLYDSDTDGWVADSVMGVFFFPYKYVDGSHSAPGSGISTFATCNTAPWVGTCL